jgi:hypothetical protein
LAFRTVTALTTSLRSEKFHSGFWNTAVVSPSVVGRVDRAVVRLAACLDGGRKVGVGGKESELGVSSERSLLSG